MDTVLSMRGAIKQKIVFAMLSVALVGFVSGPRPSYGTQLDNSNFESGDLSGWTFLDAVRFPSDIGYAQVVDSSSFGVPALQGHYSTLLVTRDTTTPECPASGGDQWSVVCPPPTGLPSVGSASPPDFPNVTPLFGVPYSAALAQQVELRSGDVISFNLQLFTNDGFNAADQVFVTLYGGGGFDSEKVCGTIPSGYCFSSQLGPFIEAPPPSEPGVALGTPVGFNRFWEGPRTWQVTAPSDGLWTITLGVGSWTDSLGSSGLLIDDFHILPQQAPEPLSAALVAIAFVALAVNRRARRRGRQIPL